METYRNTHHVYRLMYQFVWVPKYRHNVFHEPNRATMKATIHKVGYDYDIDIVELEIPENKNPLTFRLANFLNITER